MLLITDEDVLKTFEEDIIRIRNVRISRKVKKEAAIFVQTKLN